MTQTKARINRIKSVQIIRAVRVIRFLFVFLLIAFYSPAQTIQVLTKGTNTNTSLRGLSVVNDSVLWASGSNGTVARSTDGGKTFNWITVKGYEQRDFRDVEAFDSSTAIIMAVAEPAIILKTIDAGKTWKKVFEDSTKGMFLDAMDFAGNYGVVVGDPINGRLFRAITKDSGNTWQNVNKEDVPLETGEALFAASGTNIKAAFSASYAPFYYNFIVTGGMKSELIETGVFLKRYDLPLQQGAETKGANSLAMRNRIIVIVGGDFKNDKDTTGDCVIASFPNMDQKDFTFLHPQTPPHGYRSCVEFINDKQLITCGTSGVDLSSDGGMNWTLISPESFHVCQKAKSGNAVFLAGKEGRIARLNF